MDSHKMYVLENSLTHELGTDLLAFPEFVEQDNKLRDEAGDPWRWVEYGEKAA